MWNDLRFAGRLWRRFPGTAALVVVSIAVGIAAVSTIFSWAEGLILRPLPAVLRPERLVSGLVLTFAATRILTAILPRLRPEPAAVLVAAGLLVLIFTAAVALATRRGLRVDPAVLLHDS